MEGVAICSPLFKLIKEKVMSSYYVQVNADFYKGYAVEADSEEEALEIAKENFEYDYSSGWDSLDMKAEEI